MISTCLTSRSRDTISGAHWRRSLETDGLRILSALANMGKSVGKVELPEILASAYNDWHNTCESRVSGSLE